VAVAFLCLTVLSVVAAAAWLVHQHRRGVAAGAALHRDPSYQYGARLQQDRLEYKDIPGVPRTPEAQCRAAVSAAPSNIKGYSAETAFRGCMDEERALNS